MLWFVLFALTPCTVKEIVFDTFNSTYSKPINKSRTTAPTSFCSFSTNVVAQASVSKMAKVTKQIEPNDSYRSLCFSTQPSYFKTTFSKLTSGNSPPKYILYKRLKLDIA